MKNLFILLLMIFVLVSCGETKKQGAIEEAGEIMNDYVDTLEGSIGDAKDVKKLIEGNQDKLKENLDGIY